MALHDVEGTESLMVGGLKTNDVMLLCAQGLYE
jgi:hypothetical protein